jgi:DNA-binding PadR family transcriptional regulator
MALPTTSYAVLGMLSVAPMSGYELARSVERSIAVFWQISKSQVYGELARLEEHGYVIGTDVAQRKRPDKRTFRLTPSGEAALDEWLSRPGYEHARHRIGYLVKLFFAHRMQADAVRRLLGQCRVEAAGQREELARVCDALRPVPEAASARATALLGLRLAEATVAWADEVSAELPSWPRHQRKHSPRAVRDLLERA